MPSSPRIVIVGGVSGGASAAARLLSQHGFRVRNLSDGYRRYAMWKGTHTVSLACESAMQHEDGE